MEPLLDLGVELVTGDMTDWESIERAVKGVDGVLHTAAVLGGAWATSTPDDFFRINHEGSVYVMDAARREGIPIVLLSTYAMFRWDETITEIARPAPVGSVHSAYTRAKIATFYEGMARAAREAQEIMFTIPGCIYGRSLFPERALDPTSFDSALLRGLTGELERYVSMPCLWCTADDVAAVGLAALATGQSGHAYLAVGRGEEAMSLAAWCNIAAEIAGVPCRMADEDPSSDLSRYGTIAEHARRGVADPFADSSLTTAELGIEPTSVHDGLETTVAWFKELGKLP
jgi:nucleoside-diphosphate-sugar epimerase